MSISRSAPLISIVMPTRNRAHLLPYALRSALEQEFDDFDVVVVANNCTDGTRDVVAGFQDRRIRYHETDRTLSMPDNWDLAWTRAEGQYVVYLPDDDARAYARIADPDLMASAESEELVGRAVDVTTDGTSNVATW